MTQVKTKIWRGGVPGGALPAGVSPTPAQAAHVQRAGSELASPALSQTRVVSPTASAPLLGVEPEARVDAAPLPTVIRPAPSPLQSTRIMPVEALLAPLVEPLAAPSREEPVVLPRNPLGMRLLIAGLLVFTLGIWVAPRLLEQESGAEASVTRAQHAQPAPSLTNSSAKRSLEPHAAAQAKPLAHDNQQRVRSPQRSEPRAAADALANGDYPLAATLYTRLAAAHPEQPVYAEAARILNQRLASSR